MTPIIIIGCLVIAVAVFVGVFVWAAQWFGANGQFWRDFRRIARHEHQGDQQ